jgi:hypothetical protein
VVAPVALVAVVGGVLHPTDLLPPVRGEDPDESLPGGVEPVAAVTRTDGARRVTDQLRELHVVLHLDQGSNVHVGGDRDVPQVVAVAERPERGVGPLVARVEVPRVVGHVQLRSDRLPVCVPRVLGVARERTRREGGPPGASEDPPHLVE